MFVICEHLHDMPSYDKGLVETEHQLVTAIWLITASRSKVTSPSTHSDPTQENGLESVMFLQRSKGLYP